MHLLALSTARLHLALAGMLALTTGTYGLVVALAVAAVLVTRQVARNHLAASPSRAEPAPGRSHRGITGATG